MPFFDSGSGGGGGDYLILTNNNIDGGNNVMALVTGVNNIALGNSALQDITSGNNNISLGTGSLSALTSGQNNTVVGNNSVPNYNASYCSIFGYNNGDAGSAVSNSVILGFGNLNKGAANYGGNNVVAIGNQNFELGAAGPASVQSAISIGSGSFLNNTAWTNFYGYAVSVGTNNFYSGFSAGFDQNFTDSIAIGSTNFYNAAPANLSGCIVIGKNINPTGPNQIKIGSAVHTNVNVGNYDLAALKAGIGLSSTWAGLPAANSVTVGTIYRVTDVGNGGSHWYSDGTRWRVYNQSLVPYSLNAPVSGAANNTEQILAQYQIKGGMLKPGDLFTVRRRLDKSAAVDNSTVRVRMGTAGTVADTLIETADISLGGGARQKFAIQTFRILSATSILALLQSNASNPYGSIIGTPYAPVTIASLNNNIYISITQQMTAGTEFLTLQNFEFGIETVGA